MRQEAGFIIMKARVATIIGKVVRAVRDNNAWESGERTWAESGRQVPYCGIGSFAFALCRLRLVCAQGAGMSKAPRSPVGKSHRTTVLSSDIRYIAMVCEDSVHGQHISALRASFTSDATVWCFLTSFLCPSGACG
jgi:hypothetical protein